MYQRQYEGKLTKILSVRVSILIIHTEFLKIHKKDKQFMRKMGKG